jgi:hypothetical protein
MRKVIRIIAGHAAKKPITFWRLLAKGETYLARKAPSVEVIPGCEPPKV